MLGSGSAGDRGVRVFCLGLDFGVVLERVLLVLPVKLLDGEGLDDVELLAELVLDLVGQVEVVET